MSKFGVLVMGPAGAGKSTFCSALIQHLKHNRRSCFYVNLDPAAEEFEFEPDLDIKDLISLEDVMEEMGLGPNGGLIYCFEFLLENLDFLTESMESLTDEYLIIIDMPGQIELYTHVPVVPELVRYLTRDGALNVNLCAAYLLEATFVIDRAKFFAGTLSAMSAMLMLEIPHINILSKMDLVKGTMTKREMKQFLTPDVSLIEDDPVSSDKQDPYSSTFPTRPRDTSIVKPNEKVSVIAGGSFQKLNKAVAQLIDDFGLVSFLQLNVNEEDSIGAILSYIDEAIQYHEAQEVREPNDAVDEGDTAYWEED